MGQLGRSRAGVAAAFFAQGLGFAVVLTHLPAVKDRYGLDDLAITGVMFAVAVLAGLGSTAAGAFASRRGSATSLRAALVIAASGLAVAGLADDLVVFLIGVGLYGLGLGTVDASENMQAVALEARYGRSILTSFHAAWSAGGIVGALYTAGTHSWTLTAALVPTAVVIAAIALGPYLPGIEAAPDTEAAAQLPWRPLLLLGAALVLFYIADSAASSWSTIYLRDGLAATAGVAPLAYGAYQTTSLLSRVAGDFLVRRSGAVTVVRMAAGIGAVGLLLVVLAPGPAVAIAGFAVLGAGLAVVAPLTFSAAGVLAGQGTPEERRRRADVLVARLNQFNYLGFVLGGVLTGLVSSGSSLRWGYVVPLVTTAVLVLLAPAFAARRAVTTPA
ncbi:Major Facilitator Superfamily protein [Nakamurella panacisegetis]|uniref:Major Facilitator Superfamily protein n=1 Tax=Nakamurella panacisegetis TaxID=1090615 RepID=A0A1H0K522_9ACTN|nr:MFS transporter [Nakamurella panacisegetis]SDO50873.1 Major Facilitator Superfamily protein [Nakamurella panacisegetis]